MATVSAVPIKGAVQGVATIVVMTPLKKLGPYPACSVGKGPIKKKENSKTPKKLRAKTNNIKATIMTKTGD